VRRKLSNKVPDAIGAGLGPLNGTNIALDILDFEPIDGVVFIQGDFRDEPVLEQLEAAVGGRPVDVVVSDLAPNLTGITSSDDARITHLVELAVDFAARHLVEGGALVCKVFHGSNYNELVALLRANFRTVKAIKPKASRDRSSETFLVGIGLKTAYKMVESTAKTALPG
jgi:23S rRNA (uridine2552-2'-O)-methyltransferase